MPNIKSIKPNIIIKNSHVVVDNFHFSKTSKDYKAGAYLSTDEFSKEDLAYLLSKGLIRTNAKSPSKRH
jgi:cell division protein YceG involved in septum cleavage